MTEQAADPLISRDGISAKVIMENIEGKDQISMKCTLFSNDIGEDDLVILLVDKDDPTKKVQISFSKKK